MVICSCFNFERCEKKFQLAPCGAVLHCSSSRARVLGTIRKGSISRHFGIWQLFIIYRFFWHRGDFEKGEHPPTHFTITLAPNICVFQLIKASKMANTRSKKTTLPKKQIKTRNSTVTVKSVHEEPATKEPITKVSAGKSARSRKSAATVGKPDKDQPVNNSSPCGYSADKIKSGKGKPTNDQPSSNNNTKKRDAVKRKAVNVKPTQDHPASNTDPSKEGAKIINPENSDAARKRSGSKRKASTIASDQGPSVKKSLLDIIEGSSSTATTSRSIEADEATPKSGAKRRHPRTTKAISSKKGQRREEGAKNVACNECKFLPLVSYSWILLGNSR